MTKKHQPLRGKEYIADLYSDVNFDHFRTKDVVSAVKFYKEYHNNYDQFICDFPELVKKKMYLWLNCHNFDNDYDRNNEFNCFLFEYCFQDAIE